MSAASARLVSFKLLLSLLYFVLSVSALTWEFSGQDSPSLRLHRPSTFIRELLEHRVDITDGSWTATSLYSHIFIYLRLQDIAEKIYTVGQKNAVKLYWRLFLSSTPSRMRKSTELLRHKTPDFILDVASQQTRPQFCRLQIIESHSKMRLSETAKDVKHRWWAVVINRMARSSGLSVLH